MFRPPARSTLFPYTTLFRSAPIEEAPKLIEALETYDVAIGSRALDRSLITVHESRFREFAGIVFNRIVRVILRLPFVRSEEHTSASHSSISYAVFCLKKKKP